MRKHRHGKLTEIDSPEVEEMLRIHEEDENGEFHFDLVDENEPSHEEEPAGDFVLPFDDYSLDSDEPEEKHEDGFTITDERASSFPDEEPISPFDSPEPTLDDAEDHPHYESTSISDPNAVKVEKTVVDTLIVNNVIGGKGFGGQPVNVNVNTNEGKRNVYSLEDLSVPESQKGKVVSAKDEQVVKEYAIIKKGKAVVTTRRLIIDADYRLDVPIEHVSGISSSSVNELKVGKLIFGALFVIIMAISLLYDFSEMIGDLTWLGYVIVGVGVVFGIIGIILLATCFRRRFAINIYTDSLMPIASLQNEAHKKDTALIRSVITAKKGKEFDKFTGEFGALLIQLKDALSNRL